MRHAFGMTRALGLLGALSVLGGGCSTSGGQSDGDGESTAEESGESTTEESGDSGTETETETGEDQECLVQGFDFELGPPELLSDLCLMSWDGESFFYEDNVWAYDLNTVLFSDYARKDRAIFIPPGETATYVDNDVIDFPVGTVILKSFLFAPDMREPAVDADLVETRILVRYPEEWKAYPYVWDHELGDAVLTVQGDVRQIEFIGPDGIERTANYLIPQKNQCQECHEIKDDLDETVMVPIGPRPRYLNRPGADQQNQLEAFAAAGWLQGVPAVDQIPAAWDHRSLEDTPVDQMDYATITTAARDYLDVNCAYCHNPRGVNGISSQLFLNWDNQDEFHLGYCKKPGSAGKGGENREYDIVPGDAEASILVYRTETLDLGSMMPLIGRSLAHDQGVELLRAWIDGLPPDDCQEPEPMP